MLDRLKDLPTSGAVLPFVVIAVLLGMKAINVREALELLAGVGAYLAAVSGGKKSGP